MNNLPTEIFERIRQQFDRLPYPNMPIDFFPENRPYEIYKHNLITSYYLRNQKVIDTSDKIILDAGCGSGFKALILAAANPGAKIVGIDISEKSIELAEQRLKYHGYDQAEFYNLSILDLEKLNCQFDYINCDEVLYTLPEPALALKAMKSVLQPDGIIRTNLHSVYQRTPFYRAQKLFQIMGFSNNNTEDFEIEMIRAIMTSLKENTLLKTEAYSQLFEGEDGKENILMNYLLQGDKGYTVSDTFTMLEAAGLEFISMVNWQQWDLMSLFKEPENLPAFLAIGLPETSLQEQLQLFELINPIHRLLDFWCGNPEQTHNYLSVADWTDADWQIAKVHLHPQLKTKKFEQELASCITQGKVFSTREYLPIVEESFYIDSSMAICLLPLLNQPQLIKDLVQNWLQFRPLNPLTLKPTEVDQAFSFVQKTVLILAGCGYLMLETST
ncbi:class I SAM-dependent methyltransferase [Nostoc sp. MS1]|uniref:class I SAM-dependent methyltransferase n=1 Tax=Nostoc sp. MS1 TaxID=2764711 RepID=UPI001CC4AA72|nr:methyltransferase domain-containing protein [Nostoc sp. MS1]BCL37790.1 SAM-dependent methyltransferase [Nostoc sp. MS1]